MTKEEELEEGVVYYVTTEDLPNRKWLMKHKGNGFVNLEDKNTCVFNFTYYKVDTYTKATPSQIKHYEACMKANKYVEPEKVKLEIGKWYQWYHSNHKNTHIGKCLSIDKDNVNMSPWIVGRTTYNKEGSFNPRFIEEIIELPESEVQQYLPKEAEEWGEGTYVVIIDNYHSVDIGDVHKIGFNIFKDCIDIEESVGKTCFPNKDYCKWFATKQEAEEFAKALKEPVTSERYIKTMEFFNQLREPERSQAIANYDEEYNNVIPDKLFKALNCGFEWMISPEGHNYWNNINDNIKDKTYFKEPKPTQEAVHCPTQEEFDYVTEKLGYKWSLTYPFDKYTTDSCIRIGVQCYGRKSDFEGYVILSFQEWCTKNNHEGLKPWVAQVGDWVYVIDKHTACKLANGSIVQCVDTCPRVSSRAFTKKNGGYWLEPFSYRKATQAEIDSVNKGSDYDIDKPQWTYNNWYVEVSSQEEADMVIEAADKMYGKTSRSGIKPAYTEDWKYVSYDNGNYFCPLNTKNLSKSAKPRPISDFITVSDSSRLTEDPHLRRLDKPYQQYPLTPSESFKVRSNPKLLDNNVSKISSINISLKQKSKSKKL